MPHFLQSVLFLVGVLLLAPVVLVFVQRFRIRRNFDYGMRVLATDAVRRARQEYQVVLDFSLASVQLLEEKILANLHEAHLKTPISEQQLSRFSLRWGACIGEVLKRVRSGKWQRDSEKAGRGSMPVVFEPGTEAFPCAWACKRIADGPEDNVAFKVEVFSNPKFRQHLGKAPETSRSSKNPEA